jgi:hypothetical protein
MRVDNLKIISRADAKTLGLKRYFTGEQCKRGHIAEREVSGWKCVECAREWKAANPEKDREWARKDRAANPEKYSTLRRERRAASLDESREYHREYNKRQRLLYPGKEAARVRESVSRSNWLAANAPKLRKWKRDWKAVNTDKVAADTALRRARQRKSYRDLTPTQKAEIRAFYFEAKRLTNETGIVHHVDHIQPLALGGEHVPDNLRVIPAIINLKKNASLDAWLDYILNCPRGAILTPKEQAFLDGLD